MRLLGALAVAFVVSGLVPSAATSGADARARLFMLDRTPLVVRGLHFRAGETVRVRAIVRGGPRLAKSITSDGRGAFKARFVSLSLGQCAFFTVQATGAHGSRAAYTQHPPPCGPAP